MKPSEQGFLEGQVRSMVRQVDRTSSAREGEGYATGAPLFDDEAEGRVVNMVEDDDEPTPRVMSLAAHLAQAGVAPGEAIEEGGEWGGQEEVEEAEAGAGLSPEDGRARFTEPSVPVEAVAIMHNALDLLAGLSDLAEPIPSRKGRGGARGQVSEDTQEGSEVLDAREPLASGDDIPGFATLDGQDDAETSSTDEGGVEGPFSGLQPLASDEQSGFIEATLGADDDFMDEPSDDFGPPDDQDGGGDSGTQGEDGSGYEPEPDDEMPPAHAEGGDLTPDGEDAVAPECTEAQAAPVQKVALPAPQVVPKGPEMIVGEDGVAVRKAPTARTAPATPRVKSVQVKGLSLEPTKHNDPEEAKDTSIKKIRDISFLVAGLMGVAPKGANGGGFGMGLAALGSPGHMPVEFSPETARVEPPHNEEDRLPVHNDDNPLRVQRLPKVAADPFDSRMGVDEVDELLGVINPAPIELPVMPVRAVVPTLPLLSPSPEQERSPVPAPATGPGWSGSPSMPSLPLPGAIRAPGGRQQPPSALSPRPAPKVGSERETVGLDWGDLAMAGAIIVAVAVTLSWLLPRAHGETDGMREMALSDRVAVQVYLDHHIAELERRKTDVEGAINQGATGAVMQPGDFGKLETLARDRAELSIMREALMARRGLLGLPKDHVNANSGERNGEVEK